MNTFFPTDLEVECRYSQHLGPRFEAAGVTIQFHSNQDPGIHFKVDVPEPYKDYIVKGIKDGLSDHFPSFPSTASIWIIGIADSIDSSQIAFYRDGYLVVGQAFALSSLRKKQAEPCAAANASRR